MEVEVEDGDLTVIHWNNGGWLDDSHFSPQDISSGEVTFISDRGYRYTVTLGDYGGNCYSDSYNFRNTIENDIKDETCPECGFTKLPYDEYCSSCERKLKCPKCGRQKHKYDDLCSSRQYEKEKKEVDDYE